ncbi:MAG: glycosyltransferase family 4 protein, partial [Planctomycetes bacterium]|nr:glycosyltransferase family 4 protein [Planctomycetota bacterium]
DELAALAVAPRARLLVVPPAVPTPVPLSRDEARHALGISAGEHRVVAVGRCVPIKRFGDFVTAVALDRELRGDLVGTGPELSALAAGARAAAGRVTLRGAVPDIAGKLAAYDALVLPSRREGCPLVAIEAFAAGIPVVGYDVAGVRDALAHWGRGLLVPESAGPAGLLAAVRRLRAEPGLAGECIRASRAGLERFRPAAVADRLAALYSP